MKIVLAPMEGVVDHFMRQMLTHIGGIDRCTTEFVRITQSVFPERVFYRYCPELNHGGKTASGVPVYLQLLGSDLHYMAANAAKAADLGAPGIDINFGCPAKIVNRNDGGSILLKEPQRIFSIVNAVRKAVPQSVPVTVKIRLGFSDSSQLSDIVNAIVEAGASELTIHARTREDGYKPPAHWKEIYPINKRCPITIYANGEIWSPQDYRQCFKESGCENVMLGRGILARPDLAMCIKNLNKNKSYQPMQWCDVVELLNRLHQQSMLEDHPRYIGNRLKQWLGYLRRQYKEADVLFESIKRTRCPKVICQALDLQRQASAA